MKVRVSVVATRDDGVTLSQEVTVETQRVWSGVGINGSYQRETKAQVRKRLDRLVAATVNATVGR